MFETDDAFPLSFWIFFMDFNYLYARRGQSLMSADRAGCAASRDVHRDLAARYLSLIEEGRAVRPGAVG